MSRSTRRNTIGQFTASATSNSEDEVFAGHTGHIQAKSGQKVENAIGAAENAVILAETIQVLLTEGVPSKNTQTATTIREEQAPPGTPQRIGSALKLISNPRSTSSHGLDDSPLPLNLSGISAKRPFSVENNNDDDELASFFTKRPITAQTSVASTDNLTPIWPNVPYIVSNEIKVGYRLQCVFALVTADQTKVFLSETIAQTFGMLLLKVREKTGVEVSLKTIAKAAGIDASFVLKMDMTLYLSVCASLPHNYIKDVESFPIFPDDAARKLAQQALNLLKERIWHLNYRLESKYKRTVNVAETFILARFVADKLTHLGRPWKPVTIDSHERKVPHSIIAEVAQSLDRDNFEKIGQTPQVAESSGKATET